MNIYDDDESDDEDRDYWTITTSTTNTDVNKCLLLNTPNIEETSLHNNNKLKITTSYFKRFLDHIIQKKTYTKSKSNTLQNEQSLNQYDKDLNKIDDFLSNLNYNKFNINNNITDNNNKMHDNNNELERTIFKKKVNQKQQHYYHNNGKDQQKQQQNYLLLNKNDYFDDSTFSLLELQPSKSVKRDLKLSDDEFIEDDFIYSDLRVHQKSKLAEMNSSTNNLLTINDDIDTLALSLPHINENKTNRSVTTSNNTDTILETSTDSNSNGWHCHGLDKDNNLNKLMRNSSARIKLITVTILCVLFMLGEIVGGILANSIAIQTDAAHMATDIAGFLLSLFAIHMSNKESTKRMSFGFYRTEILGALISTLLIWLLTGILVYMAVERCINQDYDINPKYMLVTASCGVFFNIIMGIVLHTNITGINIPHGHSHGGLGHGHSHSHSHSHSDHGHSHCEGSDDIDQHNAINDVHNDTTNIMDHSIVSISSTVQMFGSNNNINKKNTTNKKKSFFQLDSSNINIRAATIHVLGDMIQSIGVLIAAIIIYFRNDFKLADPICTFIFSVLVILTTAPIIKDIFTVLMEAIPSNIDYNAMITHLSSINGVKKIHGLHIWSLAMDKYALAVHVVAHTGFDTQIILRDVNVMLREKYKIDKTTIQVEYYDSLMDSCNACKLPEN